MNIRELEVRERLMSRLEYDVRTWADGHPHIVLECKKDYQTGAQKVLDTLADLGLISHTLRVDLQAAIGDGLFDHD